MASLTVITAKLDLWTFLHTRSIPAPFNFPSRNREACRKLIYTWRLICLRSHASIHASLLHPFDLIWIPALAMKRNLILRWFRNEEEVSLEAHATPVLLPTIASNLSAIPPPPSLCTYFYYSNSNLYGRKVDTGGRWGDVRCVIWSATRVTCTPGFIRGLFDLATLPIVATTTMRNWWGKKRLRILKKPLVEVGVVVGDLTWKVLL